MTKRTKKKIYNILRDDVNLTALTKALVKETEFSYMHMYYMYHILDNGTIELNGHYIHTEDDNRLKPIIATISPVKGSSSLSIGLYRTDVVDRHLEHSDPPYMLRMAWVEAMIAEGETNAVYPAMVATTMNTLVRLTHALYRMTR